MNSSKNETVGNHLISFEDHLDLQYGKKGTPEREEFVEGFETFKLGVIKKKSGRMIYVSFVLI